jgi:hypothetical protein
MTKLPEVLPEEEAEALRRRTDPALAWEFDAGETGAIGPAWLLKPRSPSSPTR